MSKRENEFICPACGEINDADLDFCEFCGEDLRPEELQKDEPFDPDDDTDLPF